MTLTAKTSLVSCFYEHLYFKTVMCWCCREPSNEDTTRDEGIVVIGRLFISWIARLVRHSVAVTWPWATRMLTYRAVISWFDHINIVIVMLCVSIVEFSVFKFWSDWYSAYSEMERQKMATYIQIKRVSLIKNFNYKKKHFCVLLVCFVQKCSNTIA